MPEITHRKRINYKSAYVSTTLLLPWASQGGRGALPPWILNKKRLFSSFWVGKNEFNHFCPPWKKSFRRPGLLLYSGVVQGWALAVSIKRSASWFLFAETFRSFVRKSFCMTEKSIDQIDLIFFGHFIETRSLTEKIQLGRSVAVMQKSRIFCCPMLFF